MHWAKRLIRVLNCRLGGIRAEFLLLLALAVVIFYVGLAAFDMSLSDFVEFAGETIDDIMEML